MRELEKMFELRAAIRDETERSQVNEAIDCLSNTFIAMIGATKEYLISGNSVPPSLQNATEALTLLHEKGKEHGIEFPDPKEANVAEYVVRFADQVIRDR